MGSRNRRVTFQVEALDRRDVPSTLTNYAVFADKANDPSPGLAKISEKVDFAATKGQVLYGEYLERVVEHAEKVAERQ
jgi:hypothetical protein